VESAASDAIPPRRHLAGILFLLALVAFSTLVRVHAAFGDPNFDRRSDLGMLKSDPALLYYLTRAFAEAGGAPADLTHDPRLEWPDETDVPAELGVGQEPLVAAVWRLVGEDVPLHVVATWVMAWVASLTAIGAYLLVLERTRRVAWACFGAGLFVLLPAAQRTIGFILVREDLALPLFALHLGLAARCLRTRSSWSALASGASLALALAVWHATQFFLALEACAIFLFFLRTRANPFAARATWVGMLPLILAAELVPLLRLSGFLTSPAMLVLLALVGARLVPARPRLASLGVLALGFGAQRLLTDAPGAYAHVWDLVLAKLRFLGEFPDDPTQLSFDARLLWQGPFETLDVAYALRQHGGTIAFVLFPLWGWLLRWGGGSRDPDGILVLFLAISLVPAWWIARTVVLPALLAPCLLAIFGARSRPLWTWLMALPLLLQANAFVGFVSGFQSAWYLPPGRQAEIAQLVEWIREHVPREEPILGDFMNSPAILAHCGNPICLQPKYETDRSRRKAESFLTAFFHGTPAELARLARERFRARYLLVDRYTLWSLSRVAAGLRADEGAPRPGSAAEFFLSQELSRLASVPGFTLVYRSPPTILQSNGEPYDLFRLYRLDDG
jgi:hypothetical protein